MPRSHHAPPRPRTQLDPRPPTTTDPQIIGYLAHRARWALSTPRPRPTHCDLCGDPIYPDDPVYSALRYHTGYWSACYRCFFAIMTCRHGLPYALAHFPPRSGWPIAIPPATRRRRYGPT